MLRVSVSYRVPILHRPASFAQQHRQKAVRPVMATTGATDECAMRETLPAPMPAMAVTETLKIAIATAAITPAAETAAPQAIALPATALPAMLPLRRLSVSSLL